jgi:hypothetical protein
MFLGFVPILSSHLLSQSHDHAIVIRFMFAFLLSVPIPAFVPHPAPAYHFAAHVKIQVMVVSTGFKN